MSKASITVDLDTLHHYEAIHGLPSTRRESDPVYSIALPRMVDLFSRYGVEATLFVIGSDLEHTAHVDSLGRDGLKHEIANHSYVHDYALRHKSDDFIKGDISRAHEVVKDALGVDMVGFRTPGYNVSKGITRAAWDLGYLYDSSILPSPSYQVLKNAIMLWQKIRRRPSRSSHVDFSTTLTPRGYYRIESADSDARPMWEVPMAVYSPLRVPVIGTSLHLMDRLGPAHVVSHVLRTHGDFFHLEMHGIDFLDARDIDNPRIVAQQPDLRIDWQKKRETYERWLRVISERAEVMPLRGFVGTLHG